MSKQPYADLFAARKARAALEEPEGVGAEAFLASEPAPAPAAPAATTPAPVTPAPTVAAPAAPTSSAPDESVVGVPLSLYPPDPDDEDEPPVRRGLPPLNPTIEAIAASVLGADAVIADPTPVPAEAPRRRKASGERARPGARPRRRVPEYDEEGWVKVTTTITAELYARIHSHALTDGGGRHDKSRLIREALSDWLAYWDSSDGPTRAAIVRESHEPEPGRVHRNYDITPTQARRIRMIDATTGMSSAAVLRAAIRWRFGSRA